VTGTTAALVSGYFDLEDLGRFDVKGVREPVPVFELRGAGALRTRLDVSRARGLARFVGRDADLRTLEAALERNGQVVGVIGEAGVGKSRLCFEFVERCRARGFMVLEGRAVAHGRNVPLVPILQVFRAYFGITEPDTDRTAREKIAGRMLLLDESFREALPVVFEFLGVPDPERPAPRMDPEARQRQLFGVLRQLIQGGDQRDSVVTLVEDLHWLDAASETWIEQWVDAVPGTRRLLVVNFRPEYRAGWMQQSHFHQVPLMPLGPEATRELLADLLGQDPSTAGLAEAIHRRTAGNPFFTEEVVQALVEAGNLEGGRGNYRLVTPVEKLETPGTVQSLLAARIDRLPEREKRLLQTAAVIGREFSEPVLAAVAELPGTELAQALAKLRSAEFLYEQALYPVAEYAFKHPLTQEVAYRSQLGERRARVHAAVARAIAALHPEKLDERAALLAHHWESAGEVLEAARWHRRAADWVGTSDPATASGHWQKVRTLLGVAPESAETLALGLTARLRLLDFGWRLGIDEEAAARILAEGKAIAGRSGDAALLARLVSTYGIVRGTSGAVQEYVECALEAERLAEQADDAELRFLLQMPVYARYLVGQLDGALARCDAALALLDEHPGFGFAVGTTVDPAVFLAWFRTVVLLEMGRIADCASALDRATEMARERGAQEVLGWVHFGHTWLAEATGRVEGALQHAHQSLEIAERMGSTFSRVTALRAVAVAHLLREEWDDAARVLEEALAADAASADRHGDGRAPCSRSPPRPTSAGTWRPAGLAEASGGTAGASPQIRAARTRPACSGTPTPRRASRRRRSTGLGPGRGDGARLYAPRIHCELAELARLVGDEAGRRRELAEAERLFAAMGATILAEEIARALAG
jgi:adenylate cyclase